jgi:hypothetical protein
LSIATKKNAAYALIAGSSAALERSEEKAMLTRADAFLQRLVWNNRSHSLEKKKRPFMRI